MLYCRLMDRRLSDDLKVYSKHNVGVSRTPMKETKLREGNSIFSMTDYNWSDLTSMRHVIDALLNYSMLLQCIWPYDLTGSMLHKLYNNYSWMNYSISEAVKIKIITEHFRRVSEANAARASEDGSSPCKFYELERILKLILTEEGLNTSPPASTGGHYGGVAAQGYQQQPANPGQGRGQAAGARGRGRGRSNQKGAGGAGAKKPPAVTPNGRRICFAYNKPQGCQNPPLTNGQGCKDPQGGGEFAHCCIWYFPTTGVYCLQGHPKCQH